MQVRDVMSKNVKVLDSTATLLEAAEIMRDQDIGAIPVADANRPIGMLTDRDIVVRALADYRDPSQTRVRDIISPRLSTIYDDQDIKDAAALMAKDQVRRLLVIDHQQSPVGILSMGDLGKNDSGSGAAAAALRGVSDPHRELEAQRGTKP
jgi:CBS domain-containing protein